MNLLDLLLAAIIVGSIIAGFISGFTRAAFGIIATVVGVILGFWFYETPAGWIEGLVGSHMVANMFGFLIVFFIVLVIGGLIGRMVSGVFKVTGLGFLDRLAGAGFGFVRGLFAAAAAVAVLVAATPRPVPNWMRGSALLPYALGASDLASSIAPKALRDSLSSSVNAIEDAWKEEVQRAKRRAEKAFTLDAPSPELKAQPEPEPFKPEPKAKVAPKVKAKSKAKVPKKPLPKAIAQ